MARSADACFSALSAYIRMKTSEPPQSQTASQPIALTTLAACVPGSIKRQMHAFRSAAKEDKSRNLRQK